MDILKPPRPSISRPEPTGGCLNLNATKNPDSTLLPAAPSEPTDCVSSCPQPPAKSVRELGRILMPSGSPK
jgi:hypothetical protein